VEEWSPSPSFAAWALVAARLAGLGLAAPFFRFGVLPVRLRLAALGAIALCVLLAAPLRAELLTAGASSLEILENPLDGWVLLASELLLGGALGWGCLLVLGAVQGACSLVAQQIGLSVGGAVDPQSQTEEGTLAPFYSLTAVCVFLLLDLHHALIRAVAASFVWVPPGTMRVELLPGVLVSLVLQVGPDLLLAAATLALPVVLAMLLVSLVQGLLGRALPQAELLVLGLPLRLVVGLGVLVVSLAPSAGLMRLCFERAVEDGGELLRAVGEQ
jgi:flagellar biosynthesis protein FliR